MVVGELLAQAQAWLRAAGIDEARREAEILLAACLGWERSRVTAYPEHVLTERQQRCFECWVRRRIRREPIPYITRRAWFYGLELAVGRGVLIPRPETEVLVELFLEWAATQKFDAPILIDAGVGSGAIAIACLQHAPLWSGVGVDRSGRALQIARINRRRWGLEARLFLIRGEWLSALRPRVAHAVVSNPPYVLPDEWDTLPPEVARYEPKLALVVSSEDPLRPYRHIALGARQVLTPSGMLAFETSPRLAPLLAEQLPRWGFKNPQVRRDYSNRERVLYAYLE
ncbi:MAG: protein-(glutamine-N5) methyltransferase, release factor-specific [Armatimonadetes bacterium JP3_11]|jgi:release factor glutamine methyltransferase|nr:MAG: protein-(glutamine-N5) methyltransferase, release factor-specific [Armatimonadetes bacterium CP1_7O]OYT74971.1 MAG: protein-(glutamine-N5) methyltransferase, release factor-specific [Armatimonadetes bacterium JP3_11]RMH09110.1 MAG: peptide chain release factor N(5)-glutamine methyltransferase [Armatimonadota bacterium]